MDTLKGKQIMVWTFMGNARMYEALRDYGDRISQIGLFSFKVRATGEIYESGVAISDMLTYINRWPHIKWLLTVANDGANSIFRALRDNTNAENSKNIFESIFIFWTVIINNPFCCWIYLFSDSCQVGCIYISKR